MEPLYPRYQYRSFSPFGMPRFSYWNRYNNLNRSNMDNIQNSYISSSKIHNIPPSNKNSIKKDTSEIHNISLYSQDNDKRKSEEKQNPILEIFGIKLYFEDILLISLIFFLYNEGVNDQFLFITLILLLLS